LGEVSPKLTPEECTAALLEGNMSKNRDKNIYPGIEKGYCAEQYSVFVNFYFLMPIPKSFHSHSS
jgi:hypothetical protein